MAKDRKSWWSKMLKHRHWQKMRLVVLSGLSSNAKSEGGILL